MTSQPSMDGLCAAGECLWRTYPLVRYLHPVFVDQERALAHCHDAACPPCVWHLRRVRPPLRLLLCLKARVVAVAAVASVKSGRRRHALATAGRQGKGMGCYRCVTPL